MMSRRFTVRLERESFTLVETLVSMTILLLLAALLSLMVGGVSRAWLGGEREAEIYQNGRALLEIMGRELSQASISPHLQLIDNPALSGICADQAKCSSIFWQAPLSTSANGSVCEVGYYLARRDPTATSIGSYQLKRLFIPPNANVSYPYLITAQLPSPTDALWLGYRDPQIGNQTLAASDFASACSVVSGGVLAFWVRCIDENGNAFPWMSAGVRFNSAGYFQPAQPGQTPASGQIGAYPPWTAPTTTVQAHRLPAAVEITIITLDSATLTTRPNIPDLASYQPVSETDVPNQIDRFNSALLANGVKNARTFSTRVQLGSLPR